MIRRLTKPEEIEHALRKMGTECPEIEWQDPPVRVEPMVEAWKDCGDNELVRFLGYFDSAGELHGYLIGTIQIDSQTGELFGNEFVWVVSPKWRNTRAPLSLLKAFEIDCKASGCTMVQFGFSMELSPNKMAQMYDRLGYRKAFTIVRKNL
jgi:hypothetical protein